MGNQQQTAVVNQPTREQLMARIAQLEEQAKRSSRLTIKRGEKGTISVYGLGKFPASYYAEQWERLLDAADDIRAFIKADPTLPRKKGEIAAQTAPVAQQTGNGAVDGTAIAPNGAKVVAA